MKILLLTLQDNNVRKIHDMVCVFLLDLVHTCTGNAVYGSPV